MKAIPRRLSEETGYSEIRDRLKGMASDETAAVLRRFFKTGVGEYGQGDIFLGIKVPPLRKLAAELQSVSFKTLKSLLTSRIHEERALALMILVRQFGRGDEALRQKIYDFYLTHTLYVNNWDLVDGSAPYLVGPFLWNRDRRQLYVFARSRSLWTRRIAIVATLYFIRQNDFADALKIAEILLPDKEDLIHKAGGWMLREIGKRNFAAAEAFLQRHHPKMPRTMLRYAIERFPETLRRKYLLAGRK